MKKFLVYIINNRLFFIIYIINLLALLPLIIFSFPHYSIDSYEFLLNYDYNGHAETFLSSFRFFGALLIKLWFPFFNPLSNPTLDIIIYIVITALAITLLSLYINSFFRSKSMLSFFVINASIVVSIFNVWINNILTFPECIFILSIGNLFCFMAIIVFTNNRINKYIRIFISSIFVICSTAIYQQYIIIYFVYSILLISIYTINNKRKLKNIVLSYVKLFVFLLFNSILYLTIGICLQKIFLISPNSRVAFSVSNIIDNFMYFSRNQHSYLKGRGFFNSEILTFCYLIVIIIWVISFAYYIKNNKLNRKSVVLIITYFMAYASSFCLGLVSTSRSHRTMIGLFSVFALFSISSILLLNSIKTKILLCIVLLFVYGINVYKTAEMSIEQYKTNTIECIYAKKYFEEICSYENNTGKAIKTIEICTDKHCDTVEGESALNVDYSFRALMNYVSNRSFDVLEMDENSYKKKFVTFDWKEFKPLEQLVFKENTLYLCVY